MARVLLVCPTYCCRQDLHVIAYMRLELLQEILLLQGYSFPVTVHLIDLDLSILGQYLHLEFLQALLGLGLTKFCRELVLKGRRTLVLRSLVEELEVTSCWIGFPRCKNFVISCCLGLESEVAAIGLLRKAVVFSLLIKGVSRVLVLTWQSAFTNRSRKLLGLR